MIISLEAVIDLDAEWCGGTCTIVGDRMPFGVSRERIPRDLKAYDANGIEIVDATWVDIDGETVKRYLFGKNAHGHSVITGREWIRVPGVTVR